MFRRWLTASLALAFVAGVTWADENPPSDLDDANDALQGNDKDKTSDDDLDAASGAARGGETAAEEEIDPIQALNDIADKMKEAEDALHKAGSYKKAKDAIAAQKKAEEELRKLIQESKENQGKSAEELQKLMDEAMKKQQQAMDDATKLMGGAGNQQKKALEKIEQLIKQAKESG
ncbi:MAG: hypothetical protein AAB434_07265 [Planctomycetota bacterium]